MDEDTYGAKDSNATVRRISPGVTPQMWPAPKPSPRITIVKECTSTGVLTAVYIEDKFIMRIAYTYKEQLIDMLKTLGHTPLVLE